MLIVFLRELKNIFCVFEVSINFILKILSLSFLVF